MQNLQNRRIIYPSRDNLFIYWINCVARAMEIYRLQIAWASNLMNEQNFFLKKTTNE